jgi:hypothetical protein
VTLDELEAIQAKRRRRLAFEINCLWGNLPTPRDWDQLQTIEVTARHSGSFVDSVVSGFYGMAIYGALDSRKYIG